LRLRPETPLQPLFLESAFSDTRAVRRSSVFFVSIGMIILAWVERVGIRPTPLANTTKIKSSILGAGAFVVMLFAGPAAQAQCTSVGLNGLSATSPVVAQAAGMAVANVSASVGTLVTSINSVNTAFLTQSTALIGSPANPEPDQQGGGVWARGVGGHLSANTTATAGNISFGTPQQGNITCNTRTVEDFAGIQTGADFSRLNVNGWNLHAGSTIGYLGSKTLDATSGLNPPASFRDSLEIPFVGVYGAASYGGFLADAQVRGDFFQNEVSDDNNGLSGQRFNARGISLTGNVAYNQNLGGGWFIEPSAGIIWSRTHVDPLNVPGTGILGTPVGPGFVPPWVLTVDNIESVLGRLSVRVGTTITSGDVIWQPFASASVFDEFRGEVTSSLTSNFSALGPAFALLPTLASTVTTSSLGTYGQFGLGITARLASTAWIGYVRGDYRTGDNIEGWGVNGGLRYQFVPDAATEKPLLAKAPIDKAPVARAAYNWTGFYIGPYLGANWGTVNLTFLDDGETTNPRFAGFLGGGEIGYNYQFGKWVFGVEGDLAWTNAGGARPCPIGFFANCEMNLNWLSTATGRIGYAYWDRLLTYVKGGVAIGQDRAEVACTLDPPSAILPVVGCPSQSVSQTKVGWTAGLGSEFGLTRNVSVKSEIMYFDLGSEGCTIVGIPTDIKRNGFVSTLGVHFLVGG
jgi:opacity protein-like surface antigen